MSAALPVMINGRAAARIKHPGKISGKKCKQGSGVGGICSGDFFKFKFHFHHGSRDRSELWKVSLPDQLAPAPDVEPCRDPGEIPEPGRASPIHQKIP